jgi:YHS domain-containing protein
MTRATIAVFALFAVAGFALADSCGSCCPREKKKRCPATAVKNCPVTAEKNCPPEAKPTASDAAGGEALAAEGEETEKKTKAQTHCPVMGGKINKEVYADYQGQRVYFCCPGCKKPFQENPDKYFKKLAEKGVVPESVQKECPVSGRAVNKEVHVDYKGRRVYFCCPGCVSKFKENPEKHLETLEKS